MKFVVMKSSTEQYMMCMGCFVREQIEKRMVIGYDSGTLIYENLYGEKNI